MINKRNVRSDIGELIIDGSPTSGAPLADCFNNFFTESIRTNYNKNACSRIWKKTTGSIFLSPIDWQEVFAVIMSLRNNFSTDVKGITIRPVKFVADLLSLPLSHIINLSLESSVFPARMKLAKVTVLFKSGSKDVMSNNRPISILPVFSKVLEKILLARSQNFFDANQL